MNKFDRYARSIPWKLLAPLALPIDFVLKTRFLTFHENASMVQRAMQYVWNNQLSGDYAEFGVFEGRTFTAACLIGMAIPQLQNMRFYAFDSFEGLPDVTGPDMQGEFSKVQFSATRQTFESNLRRYRTDQNRVTIVEGFYNDSLRRTSEPREIALAWIDCDLYNSAVDVLNFLTDRLVDGAVIVFDDWFCFRGRADKGEQRACSEWLARNPSLRLTPYSNHSWSGQAFIVTQLVPQTYVGRLRE
jgi:O-methyltransferase